MSNAAAVPAEHKHHIVMRLIALVLVGASMALFATDHIVFGLIVAVVFVAVEIVTFAIHVVGKGAHAIGKL
jgi:hypothetical protein